MLKAMRKKNRQQFFQIAPFQRRWRYVKGQRGTRANPERPQNETLRDMTDNVHGSLHNKSRFTLQSKVFVD